MEEFMGSFEWYFHAVRSALVLADQPLVSGKSQCLARAHPNLTKFRTRLEFFLRQA